MERAAAYYFTYRPPRNGKGWQVEIWQGQRSIESWFVSTRVEAIAAAKDVRLRFQKAIFEMCLLGDVNAWETTEGWLYSPTDSHEGAVRATALDDMGEVVLMVTRGDETRYIRGARRNRPPDVL